LFLIPFHKCTSEQRSATTSQKFHVSFRYTLITSSSLLPRTICQLSAPGYLFILNCHFPFGLCRSSKASPTFYIPAFRIYSESDPRKCTFCLLDTPSRKWAHVSTTYKFLILSVAELARFSLDILVFLELPRKSKPVAFQGVSMSFSLGSNDYPGCYNLLHANTSDFLSHQNGPYDCFIPHPHLQPTF